MLKNGFREWVIENDLIIDLKMAIQMFVISIKKLNK
jgi:hypothetical protein